MCLWHIINRSVFCLGFRFPYRCGSGRHTHLLGVKPNQHDKHWRAERYERALKQTYALFVATGIFLAGTALGISTSRTPSFRLAVAASALTSAGRSTARSNWPEQSSE